MSRKSVSGHRLMALYRYWPSAIKIREWMFDCECGHRENGFKTANEGRGAHSAHAREARRTNHDDHT